MLEPIIDRLFSYKNLLFDLSDKYFSATLNFIKNFNQYSQLLSRKMKYKYDLKISCYQLGKYISGISDKKYNFSADKKFIYHIEKIKTNQEFLSSTNKIIKKMKNQERN